MTNQISHHDSFFKKFLGDLAVARDFLEIHLPPHLRKRCDFSTLAMESGSFIEDDLKGAPRKTSDSINDGKKMTAE